MPDVVLVQNEKADHISNNQQPTTRDTAYQHEWRQQDEVQIGTSTTIQLYLHELAFSSTAWSMADAAVS